MRISTRLGAPAARVWTLLVLVAVACLGGCQADNNGGQAATGGPFGPSANEDMDAGPAGLHFDRITAPDQLPKGAELRYELAYPAGEIDEGVLLVRMYGPEQVRAGQPFNYVIQVANLTEVPLTNVRVQRIDTSPGQNAEADATTRPAARQQQQQRQQNAQQARQQQQTQQQRRDGQQQQERQPNQRQQGLALGWDAWDVGVLPATESRSRQFTAVAETEGTREFCLAASYQPTMCARIQVVNPALALTKQGPSQALQCDEITYTYTVRNAGTGVARNVVVADELPEGLALAEGGGRMARFQIGDLRAGETKTATAKIRPQSTGEFTSRAVATSATDQAASAAVTTLIQKPQLEVAIDGPEWSYIGSPVTYQVTVTNTGDAPARDAVVRLSSEGPLDIAGERQLDQPIAPGETRRIPITVDADKAGQARVTAVANAYCAADARAQAATEISTIAALLLETVDQTDPVQVGQTTTYQIVVRNQGSGPAENVRLTAQLPQGLQFVSGQGQTDVRAEGQQLTFAPIERLAPGETATWEVEARAQAPGMVQFQLQLQSDSLNQAAIESEPTRLYQP